MEDNMILDVSRRSAKLRASADRQHVNAQPLSSQLSLQLRHSLIHQHQLRTIQQPTATQQHFPRQPRLQNMAFLTKLKQESPAYAAYLALPRPPKNAPLFPNSPHGYPIVEPGEIFCRLEGVGRPVCGFKEKSTDHLLYHMEAIHGAMRRDRPLERRRKGDVGEVERVHYFYKHLMKDEEYTVDAKTPSSPESEAPRSGVKRRAPNLEVNDLVASALVPRATPDMQRAKNSNALPRSNVKPTKYAEMPSIFSRSRDYRFALNPLPPKTKPPPLKRQRLNPDPDTRDTLDLQHQKAMQEINVKEARIKGDLKESQLREVRIKAELLEIQLVEAQIQQEVQQEKLKQIELEKGLQETVTKQAKMKQNGNDIVEGKREVVDLLDDESDEE